MGSVARRLRKHVCVFRKTWLQHVLFHLRQSYRRLSRSKQTKTLWVKPKEMFPYSKNLLEWKEKTKNSKTLKWESSNKYCAHSFWRRKKKDGEEYEPATLRWFVFSFYRYLRKEGYPTAIIEGQVFRKTSEKLVAKQKEFENSGKRKKDKGSLRSD